MVAGGLTPLSDSDQDLGMTVCLSLISQNEVGQNDREGYRTISKSDRREEEEKLDYRLYSTKAVCIMYYYIHDTAALKKEFNV